MINGFLRRHCSFRVDSLVEEEVEDETTILAGTREIEEDLVLETWDFVKARQPIKDF